MPKRALLAALILAVGIFIGTLTGGPGEGGRKSAPEAGASLLSTTTGRAAEQQDERALESRMLNSLWDVVNHEVDERRLLEDRIDELSAQIVTLEERLAATPRSAGTQRAASSGGDITETAFIEAGFTAAEAAYFKQRIDQEALERLNLRDRATREGWLNTRRYSDALRQIASGPAAMRGELDDASYDKYLFAMGRPNRVVVSSVLENSAAAQANLAPGDTILSYDGKRLFSRGELQTSTSSGRAGELVAVEVLRDGQRMHLYLPRGPLGVRLSRTRIKPGDD